MSDSVSPTRYEAASTIYGPHTLLAYQQQYARIVKVTSLHILDLILLMFKALLMGEELERGTPPPDLSSKQITFLPGVIMDNPPLGLSQILCEFRSSNWYPNLLKARALASVSRSRLEQ